MTGENFIGYTRSAEGSIIFQTVDPSEGVFLPTDFYCANEDEADRAVKLATDAFDLFSATSLIQRASFLEEVANEIDSLGETLLERYCLESGLDRTRALTERARTLAQLRMMSESLRRGDWLEASIDIVKTPNGTIDLRRVMKGIGPVVVFGASNFPLAYSTAGGDTASALAAGCPVIVKAHPYHAGTNELVAGAVISAAQKTGMPDGVFSSLNDSGFSIGQFLVKHQGVKAVGFTGSYSGGKALFDLAAARNEPIPVFAEMGSLNPIVVLSDVVSDHGERVLDLIAQSVTYGAGQFCTKPGLIFLEGDSASAFGKLLGTKIASSEHSVMLNNGIHSRFHTNRSKLLASSSDAICFSSVPPCTENMGTNTLLVLKAQDFKGNPEFIEEVFGPFSVAVLCDTEQEIIDCLMCLKGQLTCSIFTNELKRRVVADMIRMFEERAGRLIFNGVPTGVTVCPSMTHGGPFPATTDVRFTAVGIDAIRRFLRPITYQNFPDEHLPPALRDANTLGIRRRINGQFSVDNL